MDSEEYEQTQQQLLSVGGLTAGLDLDGFLRTMKTAEVWGPIQDPTLYRQAIPRMQALKDLAEALRTFQGAYERTVQTFLNEAVTDAGGPTDKRLI